MGSTMDGGTRCGTAAWYVDIGSLTMAPGPCGQPPKARRESTTACQGGGSGRRSVEPELCCTNLLRHKRVQLATSDGWVLEDGCLAPITSLL